MADDDTYDNWEDLADSKDLDKNLEKKGEGMNATKKKKQANQTGTNLLEGSPQFLGGEKSGIGGQIKILPRPAVIIDDTNRMTPQHVTQTPQMKILKRPEKSREELEKNEQKVYQQPVRTLAQREADYIIARQRIMGSTGQETEQQAAVKSPSNQDQVTNNRNNTDASGSSGGASKHGRYTNKNKNNHHHHHGHHTSPNNQHHHQQQQQQQHPQQQQHVVTGVTNNGVAGAAPSGSSVGYEPRRNNYTNYHKNSNGKGGFGR